MCKNGIEEVHTTLVGSQGAHRIGEVKKTNKKKKERMKNGREEFWQQYLINTQRKKNIIIYNMMRK